MLHVLNVQTGHRERDRRSGKYLCHLYFPVNSIIHVFTHCTKIFLTQGDCS